MINRISKLVSQGRKYIRAFQTPKENRKDWTHAGAEV